MTRIEVITELQACRRAWDQLIPRTSVYDMWEVRKCFQDTYRRPPLFIVAKNGLEPCGLLPLSWVEESGCFGYFPGETWQGRTWLEHNRLVAPDSTTLELMLAAVPGPIQLRYLRPSRLLTTGPHQLDEWGYYFYPPRFRYDMALYLKEFSAKAVKRIHREVTSLAAMAPQYRFDRVEDFEHLVRLNLLRFGEKSYFADSRFCNAFRHLSILLEKLGLLRMTTILLGGEPVAVDMGCLLHGTYTLLAGGTHAAFPGIAKLINLHHLDWACQEKLRLVDFLCGDFSWKTYFHLTPRPLYQLKTPHVRELRLGKEGRRDLSNVS